MTASVGALLPALASVAADVSEAAKLLALDGAVDDRFGFAAAVAGDTAVVAADGGVGNSTIPGSAYVFRYDGTAWVEEAKLMASHGAAADRFGVSVAVAGDTAVVGAFGDDDNGTDSGSAYVFRYDGTAWAEPPDHSLDYFGHPIWRVWRKNNPMN